MKIEDKIMAQYFAMAEETNMLFENLKKATKSANEAKQYNIDHNIKRAE
jgi:hypothetical protein